jgi:LPXTG-motif cell wall-anchored protein
MSKFSGFRIRMNLRLYIICIAAVFALVVPAFADNNNTATVHGEVYGWDTFEPLENAVVSVNSTPSQSMVAKYGTYSFELEPGNYSITAKYYQNNTTTYSATEPIMIKGGGTYVLDLLLLPVYSEVLMEDSQANVSSKDSISSAGIPVKKVTTGKTNSSNNVNISDQTGIYSSTVSSLLMALAILLLLAGGYHFSKKRKKPEIIAPSIEKANHSYTSFSELQNNSESSITVADKKVDPEMEQDSQINTQETTSLRSEAGLEYETPTTELVTEPEAKSSFTERIDSESKESTKGQVVELESRIPEKKILVENIEGHPVQEIETEKTEIKEEDQNNSIDKLADNQLIETIPKKKLPLPDDLRDVLNIIRGQGGRITQKDLRSKLKYSEGKVSLMLADLERRDLIEKFKRGRGNVVIIKDEERKN